METKINEFINTFKEKLINNCENIVSIYLFGSLAYGGFDTHSSDIDINVITKTLLNKNEIIKIKNIHNELIELNNIWGNRLEVSYTPLFMLQEKGIPNIPRPYFNKIFYEKAGYGNEWLINNYLILNYGKNIYGQDFKNLINYEITIEDIKICCKNDFYKEWHPKLNNSEWLLNSENQAYIVLNICRIIYTLQNEKVGNKKEAAKWVKDKYIQWKELIEEAERWTFNKHIDKQDEIKEYIKYMENVIKYGEIK